MILGQEGRHQAHVKPVGMEMAHEKLALEASAVNKAISSLSSTISLAFLKRKCSSRFVYLDRSEKTAKQPAKGTVKRSDKEEAGPGLQRLPFELGWLC